MQKSTMRIEDACIWRKLLAESPDATMTHFVSALRTLAKSRSEATSEMACRTLLAAGFETGIKESK